MWTLRCTARRPRAALVATATWLVLAPVAFAADPPPADDGCLERAAVVVYLHQVQDRVMDTWVLPEDLLANHEVVVKLRFAADGRLLGYRVVSATSQRLARSVTLALSHTGPFAPLPSGALCLVGRTILTTFTNPA